MIANAVIAQSERFLILRSPEQRSLGLLGGHNEETASPDLEHPWLAKVSTVEQKHHRQTTKIWF
jgi:hypothetical protein